MPATDADPQTRFMRAFNRIETALQSDDARARRSSSHQFENFSSLVRDSRRLTDAQRRQLLDVARLRNAIVHDPGRWDGPIAAPHPSLVEWLERQADKIERPPRVLDVLKLVKPIELSATADVTAFLAQVHQSNYSQAPVRDAQGGLHLITTNAVARWVATGYELGVGLALDHTTVQDVLRFRESDESLVLRPRDLSAAEAARIFAGSETEIPPAAIGITHSGKESESLLGLCVRADVAELIRATTE